MVINRTQALVMAFFGAIVIVSAAIAVLRPEVFRRVMRLPSNDPRPEIVFFVGLGMLVGLVAVGVLRRWRWMFWLLLVVFLSGALRVPVAVLQLTGFLGADAPAWYLLLQGVIGLAQCGIGTAMIAGYRRSGVWGAFAPVSRPAHPEARLGR